VMMIGGMGTATTGDTQNEAEWVGAPARMEQPARRHEGGDCWVTPLQLKTRGAIERLFASLEAREGVGSALRPVHLERFNLDSASRGITVTSVNKDDVRFLAEKLEDERAQGAASAAALHTARLKDIQAQEAAALSRIKGEFDAAARRTQLIEQGLREKWLTKSAQMLRAFSKVTEYLDSSLGKRKADVTQHFGTAVRAQNIDALTESKLADAWSRVPQPVTVQVCCLRAVRDKVPRGRYSIRATLFDRLAGNPLAQPVVNSAGAAGWEPCSKTGPKQHHSRMRRDAEIFFGDSLRLMLPAERALDPAMCLVFELVLLKGRRSARDEVVAWGALPICDASFQYVHGKLKTALLYGEIDPAIDKYSLIETAISSDLDNWLCNLYFEITLDARSDSNGRTEYDAQQEYSRQVLRLKSGGGARGRGAGQQGQGEAKASTVSGLQAPSKRASRGDIVLEDHRFSLRQRECARVLKAPRPVNSLKLVWRNTLAEISGYAWRTTRGAVMLGLTFLAFVGRTYAHFLAQLAYLTLLNVPVIKFDLGWNPFGGVDLVYDTQQLKPFTELGVIAVGNGAVLVALLVCIGCALLCQLTVGYFEESFSAFLLALCLATFLDPWIVLLVDIFDSKWEGSCTTCSPGDSFKLYKMFRQMEGAGYVGIGLTAFAFLVHAMLTLCVAYMYTFHVHSNGQVQDLVRRSEGTESEFVCPDDEEISFRELEFICKNCSRLHKRHGYSKEVLVSKRILVDKSDASLSEELLRITIVEVAKDNRKDRSIWRRFEMRGDGRILEIFADLSEAGRQKASQQTKLDALRRAHLGEGT
jgi:hypothetical protein